VIHLARPGDVEKTAAQLAFWRQLTHEQVAEHEYEFNRESYQLLGWGRRIGGGAPTLPVTLDVLKDAAVNTTFTGPLSILSASATPGPAAKGPIGPYSTDYFKTEGACWMQEAMGIISTTGTPTIAFGTYFGVVVGTIATMLCITPTITTASGLANVNWYYKALGRTVQSSQDTSTTLVTGILFGNIEVLAASIAGEPLQYAVNATPPTAVTTDLSTAACLDIEATWGTSAAGNSITTNYYELTSRYS
jgi:hypothetical protein